MEPQQASGRPRRVTLVAGELLGYVRTGGLGTATTFLSVALARMGHDVELLFTGEPPAAPMSAEWAQLYEGAGVAIRTLPPTAETVEPPYFAQTRAVELALCAEPPDVVIAQDLAAPAYSALRLRQLGVSFERTLFVVYCHGTRQWITDVSGKVRVLPGALAITALERGSLELADVVVSPSAYLVDWMRRQGWRLPETTLVIPYLTRSVATGDTPARVDAGGGVDRIAFFGRLEERKGVKPFALALNALEPELLERVELEFVGRATPAWTPERVEELLSESTRSALRAISFQTDLDQPEALEELSRRGTLAVMPSLEDNSPNAVYECLERGIPFIAGSAGGAAELVAPEDRAVTLCEPTPEGVEAALRHALTAGDGLRPRHAAFDPEAATAHWAEVIAMQPKAAAAPPLDRAADWVLFPEDDDASDGDLRETLLRAQAASGADVVTCGVSVHGAGEHLFIGEPGGLGVLSNAYGTVALIRRSVLEEVGRPDTGARDSAWPLLARLSASGARIVSIPQPLVARAERPGDLQRDPRGALAVAQELEQALPESLQSLARLAAGLAADSQATPRAAPAGLARRARAVLRRSLARR